MKKSDIAMIILIASISMVVAYFVVKSVPIFQSSGEPKKVATFEQISPSVQEPDPDVFNDGAINPTVEVIIGTNASGSDGSKPNATGQ